ncbi:MAG TPA: hypothetical protein VMT95_07930 [Candidatus Binatia bacterium]|nr:hypothetical protein [Candidatus Binatia bacterium]
MKNRKPIVCTLTSREREARGDWWQQLLVRWSARIAIVEGGVTIRFDDAGARTELEHLVAQERRCCKWMKLDLRDEGRGLVLTVGAESGDGADAIRNMMAFGAVPVSSDRAP